jgi:hypothetical protein
VVWLLPSGSSASVVFSRPNHFAAMTLRHALGGDRPGEGRWRPVARRLVLGERAIRPHAQTTAGGRGPDVWIDHRQGLLEQPGEILCNCTLPGADGFPPVTNPGQSPRPSRPHGVPAHLDRAGEGRRDSPSVWLLRDGLVSVVRSVRVSRSTATIRARDRAMVAATSDRPDHLGHSSGREKREARGASFARNPRLNARSILQ